MNMAPKKHENNRSLSSIGSSKHCLRNITCTSKLSFSTSLSLTNTSIIRKNNRQRGKAFENYYIKSTATYLPSRSIFDSDHFINVMHLQVPDTHRYFQCQPFIISYSFRCYSSHRQERIKNMQKNKILKKMCTSSTIWLASGSTAQLSNERGTPFQPQARSSKLDPFHVYSQCMVQPNNDLIQHRNRNSKTFTIQRRTRHSFTRLYHKYLMSRKHRPHYTRKCHAYFAEIDCRNLSLESSQAKIQACNIMSTCKCRIDFDKNAAKSFSRYGKTNSHLNQADKIKTNKKQVSKKKVQPLVYPPDTCVSITCDPNECMQHLQKISPYGSNVSTQSKYIQKNTKKRREDKKKYNSALLSRETPSRQAMQPGSKCSCSIQFYKKPAQRQLANINKNQVRGKRNTLEPERKRKALKQWECEPGVSVPRKCEPTECYRRLQEFSANRTASTSHSSNASPQSRKLRAGKEKNNLIPFECRSGTCIPGKCDPRECIKQALNRFDCEPGVCIPDKCNVSECYLRLKNTSTDTSLTADSKATSRGSQASTEKHKKTKRELKQGKAIYYKDMGASIMPIPKTALHIPNRQAVHIGSKCSFDIEFYKSMPQNGFVMNNNLNQPRKKLVNYDKTRNYDQGDDSSSRHKLSSRKKKVLKPCECRSGTCIPGKCDPRECIKQALNRFDCEPGVCIPDKCNVSECYLRLKNTSTDTSLTADSKATSRGSQASTEKHKKTKRELKQGKAIYYKDMGASSMPIPKTALHIPNRQAVHIGSKCSFDIEFYKSMPQNGFVMNNNLNQPRKKLVNYDKTRNYDQGDDSSSRHKLSSRKKKVLKPCECRSGTCVPGKCDPGECIKQVLNRFDCDPGVCVPGKCNISECFLRLKNTSTDTSLTADSNATSRGSQASTEKHKKTKRELKQGKAIYYKDKSASSMPRPKTALHMPNRQAVRIGSKCSFNIEFYKSMPQNGFVMNNNINPSGIKQGDDSPSRHKSSSRKKHVLNPFECGPGTCVPGKCDPGECIKQVLNRFDCDPGVCVPGKCNISECFLRLKNTSTDTSLTADSNATSRGSQASTEKHKKTKRELKQGKAIYYKDKSASSMPRPKTALHMPNRQAVHIGSKCSFNIEFYKSMPQNGSVMNNNINPPGKKQGDDLPSRHKSSSRKKQVLNPFECRPGTCVPGQCNVSECFQRLKSTGTDTSLTTDSNATSRGSQAYTKTRKKKEQLLKEENAILYKDKGASSMPRPKTALDIPNRQAVHIGSKCSFNIEFYKSMPQNGFVMNNNINPSGKKQGDDSPSRHKSSSRKKHVLNPFECRPGTCVPGQCNVSECFQRLKSTGTDTSLTTDSNATSRGSQAYTKTRKKKEQLLKEENAILYKDKGASSMPRPKTALEIPNRQAVRIGSKCSFNIEFYKSMPQNGFLMSSHISEPANISAHYDKYPINYDQGDTPSRHKSNSRKKKVLKPFECRPGTCVPGKCNVSECFQRINSTGTDASLTAYSNAMSRGSQASNKKRKKTERELKRGNAIYYKDTSALSMPSPKMALHKLNRQAVHIGSKCSFNIEFYKSTPQNGFVMNNNINQPTNTLANYDESRNYDQGDNSSSRHKSSSTKKHVLNPFECRPGTCVPGKCDPGECIKQVLNRFDCDPGVCVPGKCNISECFLRLKNTSTDTSLTADSKATSRGSQASTKKHKKTKRELKQGKAIYYKDMGASSMPRPKVPLHVPNMQVVRIGSTCSFNIEFYKGNPEKGLVTREYTNESPNLSAKVDTPIQNKPKSRKKRQELKSFDCKPGICAPGKCDPGECFQRALKGFDCEPGVCIPGKCNVSECFQRLKSSGTDRSSTAYSNATSRDNQASTKKRKKTERELKQEKAVYYKDKSASSMPRPKKSLDIPNRQAVRIGSKCSFNIEFYKMMPQNPLFSGQNNEAFNSKETMESVGKNSHDGTKGRRKKTKMTKKFECEPGICVPGKCDPNKCFAKLQNRLEGTSTTDSLASSKATSQHSQTKKGKESSKQKRAGKETLYKEKAASTLPRNKMPLHIPNRQVVRIGSQFGFNIDFYKDRSQKIKGQIECEPGVCVPGKCDPVDCYKLMNPYMGKNLGPQTVGADSHQKVKTSETESNASKKKSSVKNLSLEAKKVNKCTKALSYFKKCCKRKQKLDLKRYSALDQEYNTTIKQTAYPKYEGQTPTRLSARSSKMSAEPSKLSANALVGSDGDTPSKVKSTAISNATNAGTQSRKYPLVPKVTRKEKSSRSNVCDCGEKICPSISDRLTCFINYMLRSQQRNARKGDCIMLLEPIMDYEDNFSGNKINERGVLIGSDCGFNFKFTKKKPRKRAKKVPEHRENIL